MLILLSTLSFAQTVQHIYDENGRLSGTIAPTGDAARWTYDAAGNITKIDRFTATQVSIIEFTPNAGPGGGVVTIWGSGFSATPGLNTVTFNGLAATVSAATANKLTVTAPAGATSGAIAVTSPNGTATSLTNFTVAASQAAPTISGFSPAIGLPGAVLTVNGTNLPSSSADGKWRINRNLIAPSASTTTQLTSAIPTSTTSGKVSVTTAVGTATSSTDLFVVPSGYTAANVDFADRTTVGGADKVITFNTAGKIGLLLFDANQSDKLRIRIVSTTITTGGMSLLTPDGSSVFQTANSGPLPLAIAARDYITPFLGKTGTYTLLLGPGTTGTITVRIEAITQSVVLDGAGVSYVWTGGSNRKGAFLADIPEGTWCGFAMKVNSFPAGSLNLEVQNPTGLSIATSSALSPGMSGVVASTQTLNEGIHTLIVSQGAGADSGDTVLWLSRDVLGSLTPYGTPVTFSTSRPGQKGRYSFSGTAGQRVSIRLQVPSGSFTSGGTLQILRADGTTVVQGNTWANLPDFVYDFSPLPATETYFVLFTPGNLLTGNATLTLLDTITGPIAIDGASVNFVNVIGQNGRYAFTAAANQNLGLGMVVNSISAGNSVGLSVVDSNNTPVYSNSIAAPATNGLSGDLIKLAAGNYFVQIDPFSLATVNASLTLSTDLVGSITAGGAPVTFTTTRPGRNARYTFNGAAGQRVSVRVQVPSGSFAGGGAVRVVRADGTTVVQSQPWFTNSDAVVEFGPLPATEAYTLFLTPTDAYTGSVTLTLIDTVTGPIAIDGASVNFVNAVGQNARYTFSTSTIQNLGVGLTINSMSAGGGVGFTVFNSTNTSIFSNNISAPGTNGISGDLSALPVGTYSIQVDPSALTTLNASVTLSTDAVVPITSGSTATFSVIRPGRNGRYTFSANNGQQVTVAIPAGSTIPGGGTMRIINSSGGVLQSFGFGPTASTITIPLNATGTWTLFITPANAALGDVTFTLTVL